MQLLKSEQSHAIQVWHKPTKKKKKKLLVGKLFSYSKTGINQSSRFQISNISNKQTILNQESVKSQKNSFTEHNQLPVFHHIYRIFFLSFSALAQKHLLRCTEKWCKTEKKCADRHKQRSLECVSIDTTHCHRCQLQWHHRFQRLNICC